MIAVQSKLTDRQRREIRFRYAEGWLYAPISQKALADEYGVDQTTISNVVNPGQLRRRNTSDLGKNRHRQYRRSMKGIVRNRISQIAVRAEKGGYAPADIDDDTLTTWLQTKTRCDICDRPLPMLHERHLDHCHKTGKARGIVCCFCNRILGLAEDSPALLQSAINYLEGHA